MASDREERIRQLAHEIWEREGHPHGRDAEHWRLATEAYEAERARSRRDDAGEVIPGAFGTSPEWTMRTPPVASPAVATPSGAAANQPVARRKRRTKAEMEATRAAEAAAPNARRGRKPGGDVDPQAAETAPVVLKRKRRTKAEMAAAAAGVAGAAVAVAATVAVTKRRRGSKAETVGQAGVMETIPVIDISPVVTGSGSEADVVRAVESACRDIGFFLVTGHGVPERVTKALYDRARSYFDEPPEWKARQGQDKSVTGGVSFSPIAEEALAATLGDKTPGDMKESLNYGPLLAGGSWPDRPPGLKAAFADYFREMEVLARRLRRIFCLAIGLPEDHFEPAFENHLSALRVINYPAQDRRPEPGQLRAGAHTDYGFITILRSEASPGGLQVRRRDGTWVDAPAIEGAFVVNIGDALMRWTNDQWISTLHRVANPPEGSGAQARRQSIPFFLNPSADTLIEVLPAFTNDGAKYPPISFADYIAMKTEQAFGKG